jgi:hypothetical protein
LKIANVVIVIVSVGLCLVIFPYANDYLIQPAYELAQGYNPEMSALDTFLWQALPFMLLFFIIFGGLWMIRKKIKGDDDNDGY